VPCGHHACWQTRHRQYQVNSAARLRRSHRPTRSLTSWSSSQLARDALPPAHFGYIATGADDDRTVVRNHEAFSQYEIRANRFNDLSHLDPSISLFGAASPSPIYLSARGLQVSAMRAFYAEGELAVARAAKTRSTQLMLSTGTSTSIEAINEARGAPVWQQLYPTDDWSVTAGSSAARKAPAVRRSYSLSILPAAATTRL